ncbi:MAG: hypothetical protein LBO69_02260 [Ignavibacteria bacterium]|nr:hypothetical protein [Ignavibacteria bacterium]
MNSYAETLFYVRVSTENASYQEDSLRSVGELLTKRPQFNFVRLAGGWIPNAVFNIEFDVTKYARNLDNFSFGRTEIIGFIVFAFFVIGLFNIKRKYLFLLWLMVGYWGILLLTPQVSGGRYWVPQMPLFLLFVLWGICSTFTFFLRLAKKDKLCKFVIPIVTIASLAILIPTAYAERIEQNAKIAATRYTYLEPDCNCHQNFEEHRIRSFFDACLWIDKNLPADAKIASRREDFAWWYAKRRCIPMPAWDATPEEVVEYFTEKGTEYIILDAWYSHAFHTEVPAAVKYPDKFEIIHFIDNPNPEENKLYVVKFHPDGKKEEEE